MTSISVDELDKLINNKTLELQSETFKFIINQHEMSMSNEQIINYKVLISLQKELNDLKNELKLQNVREFPIETEFEEFQEQRDSH